MNRMIVTENGLVQGLPAADPRITSFKGIPFAAPPIGKNRWRAPQPAENWEGILKVYEFAPISMQEKVVIDVNNIYTREWSIDPDIVMNEDCLYLNIWAPADAADQKLPVFVWYFGGGLQVGHTSEMEFDGERFARRGIILVTVNYRLNVFGFFSHPEITKEAPKAPANFGHLDQQAGTLWVKRNIAAFGGDPNNITIGGQSAGGGSVLSQLTSPQNKDLFQRAIIDSGMITSLYPDNFVPEIKRNLAEAELDGVRFFEFLGVSSLAEARELDAEYVNVKGREFKKFWDAIIDHEFSVGNSFELFVQNKRWKVPVLFGHTSSEFYSVPKVNSINEFCEMASALFGEDAEEYLKLCRAENGKIEEVIKRASVRGIEYAIRVAAQANAEAGENTSLYYYNFDAEIPGWDHPGTFHSVDLWFFFETLAKCWRPFVGKHYDLARQMCNYWSNFIRNGDPNGKDCTGEDMPVWEPYTPSAPYGMRFGDQAEFDRKQPEELMQFLVKQYFVKR